MNLQESIRILKGIAKKIANKLHCDRYGSCVHFAEIFVEEVNEEYPELLNDFDVIEGYVNVKFGDGIPQEHTWIRLNNGDIIDPTFSQFDKYDKNAQYSKKRTKVYSGQEYYDEGKEGSWFSERRKKLPSSVFKKGLQENIQRIREMMGLNEISNPYSITWLEPTREYFTQELDELLGNEMRFSKNEFFHPQNYDLMYSLFPHTFKLIAEHSKGSEVDNQQEIKDILLDKEISDLMDDWDDFKKVLLKDKQSQKEAFRLFNMGRMVEWDDDKIDNTFYMGRFSKEFPGMFKDTTSSGLIKQMTNDDGEVNPHHKGYVSNIENLRNKRHRELPAPFVIKLPSGGREGNEYTLIGGHKRSTIANQLNVPISVWFINLSE